MQVHEMCIVFMGGTMFYLLLCQFIRARCKSITSSGVPALAHLNRLDG